MKKISKLKIDRFRGIRDLEIENLTQVNLIVGDNNCGKTSMLEALQFLRSGSAANLFKIARLRDRGAVSFANSLYDNFICMFPKDERKLKIRISGEYGGAPVSCMLVGTETRELLDLNELDRFARTEFKDANGETETDVFRGNSLYTMNEQSVTEEIQLNRFSRATGTSLARPEQIEINYVAPFEHLKGNVMNRIIKNDAYKEICLKALQLFDPEIEDVMILRGDVQNRPVDYLRHSRLGNMPLSSYGDGIKKVLLLSNAIAGAANGILLIDEIETAIHKKYYDDIFGFIVKACKTFNVQMFITTHSIEAIDGLLDTQNYETQTKNDAISVVTLKRESNKTYSRALSGREVFENREAFNFEVRL